MIRIARGNLLEAPVEAMVNTVNCVGFMGKGIALQFKQAFPANFRAYEAACKADAVVPGRMLVYDHGMLIQPRYIINFPTKRHWRGKSRMDDIEAGLTALLEEVRDRGIRSIAIPPLGCGLGGLDWDEVRPRIEAAFASLPGVDVLLYAPTGAPAAKTMPVRTERPRMTAARALFIKLMETYAALDYSRTLLEVQKLAYFLQVAGEPLRLRYEAGTYGPYAHNLNKVMERLEGHYIRGYGDSQRPDAELELLPGAVEAADACLDQDSESRHRLARVTALIEGFETPYGMELLATVHWVGATGGRDGSPPAGDLDQAVEMVHAWNPRKQQIFKPEHVRKAWDRLAGLHWLGGCVQGPASHGTRLG
ncbi:MAG TPA: macro domain-containing protein [Longimicrobium sp.]|nr:macro domain-containing protein [Longimicrobium sp.]